MDSITDSGTSGGQRRGVKRRAACEIRGFHGPFTIDQSRPAGRETATCMMCGDRVSTAEHLAAYQIALFHGLVG